MLHGSTHPLQHSVDQSQQLLPWEWRTQSLEHHQAHWPSTGHFLQSAEQSTHCHNLLGVQVFHSQKHQQPWRCQTDVGIHWANIHQCLHHIPYQIGEDRVPPATAMRHRHHRPGLYHQMTHHSSHMWDLERDPAMLLENLSSHKEA